MADETMQAVRLHGYGGPEVLVLERAPRPTPGEGQVLIRVQSAGVNPADWKLREGYMRAMRPLTFPAIPGFEASGVVEALGPGVGGFQLGQAVYGAAQGAYAEYALAPGDDIMAKPEGLSFDEAAGVRVGAATAWRALFDAADLQPGQRVLVHGAAGGVGLFAVQLARWKGAEAIGTASAGNHDFVYSLGASQVIDYRSTPFEGAVHDVDVVLDTIGGDTQQRSFGVLRPGGILVSVVQPPSQDEAAAHGVRAVLASGTPGVLNKINDLIVAGELRSPVGKAFPLAAARQAQEYSRGGHLQGKIVLHVAG